MGGAASVLPPDMLKSMSRMDHDAQLKLFQFVRKRIHAKEEELGVSREAKELATERSRRIEAEAVVRALKQRLDKFVCLARDIGEADNTSTNSTSMFNSSAIANETYPEGASPPPSEQQEQLSSDLPNTPSFFSSPLQQEQKRLVQEAGDAGHHREGDGGDSNGVSNNRMRVLSGCYSDSESGGASSLRHNEAADTGAAALQPQTQPHPQQPPAFLNRVRTVSLPSSPSPRKLPPPAVAARVVGQLENILPGPALVDDALKGTRTEDTLKIMTMTRSEPRRVEHSFYARERTEVSVDIGALVEVLDVSLTIVLLCIRITQSCTLRK